MKQQKFRANEQESRVWWSDRSQIFSLHKDYHCLFTSCFHNSELCEYLSVEFLQQFSNPKPLDYTDDLNGDRISLPDLWNELISEGMQHPFLLRLCKEPLSLRLETGNQRISIFAEKGISWVPCELEIAPSPIGNLGNGSHVVAIDHSFLSLAPKDELGVYDPSRFLKEFI